MSSARLTPGTRASSPAVDMRRASALTLLGAFHHASPKTDETSARRDDLAPTFVMHDFGRASTGLGEWRSFVDGLSMVPAFPSTVLGIAPAPLLPSRRA